MEAQSSLGAPGAAVPGNVRLVIVNTHPIQYFAPFYAELGKNWSGKFKVLYGSTRGLAPAPDSDFSTTFQWDVNLLFGYDSEFLPEATANAALPAERIRCRSLSNRLSQLRPEAVLVHGYAGPLAHAALRWAHARRCPILMRGDTWTGLGESSGRFVGRVKRLLLPLLLWPATTHFLAVGVRNAAYWREIGGLQARIDIVPYGVDSRRFCPWSDIERENARRRYGFSSDTPIIGYFGKLTEKKGILGVLRMLKRAATRNAHARIIIVGDGPLRPEIAALAADYPIDISLLGFRNQVEMADLYRIADIVIVPSLKQETWGFVVQEALACGVPVAVSDSVGCAPDLVKSGLNGWILPAGAWSQWADFLIKWMSEPKVLAASARTMAGHVPDFSASARAMARVLEEVLGPASEQPKLMGGSPT